jgi:hypothetical protein
LYLFSKKKTILWEFQNFIVLSLGTSRKAIAC